MRNALIRTLILSLLVMSSSLYANAELILNLPGQDGPGKGKKVVLISGDEEYRSEEAMPMLGKILSQKYGFDCKVLFAWDKSKSHIDPNNQHGVVGWNELNDADLMIIGTRFRKLGKDDLAHLMTYLKAGKPVIGIRTATHGIKGPIPGGFGPGILGEGWVNHHGKHKKEGARGVINEKHAKHPVLNSVKDVFAPSDVYGIRKVTEDNATILLYGEVTETLDPKSKAVAGPKNEKMQPFAWLRTYNAGGKDGTAFCTTAGASVDLVSEDLRRIIVNAAFHLTGLEVPAKADVDYVDPFYPSFYGFIKDKTFWPNQNKKAADFGLGKSPSFPDPKGTPTWNFRPRMTE